MLQLAVSEVAGKAQVNVGPPDECHLAYYHDHNSGPTLSHVHYLLRVSQAGLERGVERLRPVCKLAPFRECHAACP